MIENQGSLKVFVQSASEQAPIEHATVEVYATEVSDTPLHRLHTDLSGQTEVIPLKTPPLFYTQNPNEPIPYTTYRLKIFAEGYETLWIDGTELIANSLSLQPARLQNGNPDHEERIIIPEHTLIGSYEPKGFEPEQKPLNDRGEIVLSRVVIPETIVVHDGSPSNSSAKNYYVPYTDYIKNVASSEIYPTWPKETLVANILAIMSFTLNRVYTEWYRNKGYDFTITSSTAYDHKWIYGRNIFESISTVVDEIFTDYLSRPGVLQPLLAQYCDGKKLHCPDMLSQWGSKALGDQGYAALDILRHYYGDNLYINTAEQIAGIPASYPGYDLTLGSSGEKVKLLQQELNAIGDVYGAIPVLTEDGIFGSMTKQAVLSFQSIFGLEKTGVVDFSTWYKISQIYVGVTRIGELS